MRKHVQFNSTTIANDREIKPLRETVGKVSQISSLIENGPETSGCVSSVVDQKPLILSLTPSKTHWQPVFKRGKLVSMM